MKCADCLHDWLNRLKKEDRERASRVDATMLSEVPEAVSAGSHGRPMCLKHFINYEFISYPQREGQ